MTTQIPKPGLADKLLSIAGKKRAVRLPKETMGPYGYYVAEKESFVRALLRPKDAAPPEGWTYWDAPGSGEKK